VFVSFVIPTLNQAAFLRKCIDSCLAQNLPEHEIIVVDGLSTDGTQEILAGYGDKVRWTSEKDRGKSDAINKGMARARGEVVGWINSDDYYAHGGVLRRVLSFFEADPELDILYGDGLMVTADGTPFRTYRGWELRSLNDVLIRPAGIALQPSLFFRRHLFAEAGGLSVEMDWAVDCDLWPRMFPRARKIRYTPEVFACAAYHPGAGSIHGMWKQVRELCLIKRRYAPLFPMSLKDRLRMRLGMASLYAYWLAVKLGLRRAT
jgi:glycosyltransferase involved in cell wall biosynthesis